MKKKICAVITNRASYGRIKTLLRELNLNKKIELQIIVGGSLLLYQFGKAVDIIEDDDITINKKINFNLSGYDLVAQSKSTGLAIVEITSALNELKPDAVITFADRFETMATAISSTYLNIFLIHIQGGEISGNIDDRVRHSISKLSDYHFPATNLSKLRLISMGEVNRRISMFGCPSIDLIKNTNLSISNKTMAKYGGTGSSVKWGLPYILVLQHSVTTSFGESYKQMKITLEALKKLSYQKIILWPNIDAGSDDISKAIRELKESSKIDSFHFFRNFDPDDYLRVLANSICAVGNSSSFLREGSFLGTPAVIIGDRQKNRESANNVVYSNYNKNNILKLVNKQINHGKYRKSLLFGNGNTSKKIATKISQLDFSNIK